MFLCRIGVGIALGLWAFAPALAHNLMAYTEEWPPYNYADGAEVKGISTDILRAACAAAKMNCSFKIVPWARAYKIASITPNTILYTTARKPSRENEFIWVGPILPRTTWVYAKTSNGKVISSFNDLAQTRIGVVREEAAQQDLEAAGVPTPAFTILNSNADVLRLLMLETIDAMVDTEVGMDWNLRKARIDPSSVKKLMKLSDGGAYYFALNLNSDPAVAFALQTAIDKLKRDGKVDAILRHYSAAKK